MITDTDENGTCGHGYTSVHAYDFCPACVAVVRSINWPKPVITHEEARAAQRYDAELLGLVVDQTLRAGGDLYRERTRADKLEQENDRLSAFERRTRNPYNDWVPE
jgi:hypothetical protein